RPSRKTPGGFRRRLRGGQRGASPDLSGGNPGRDRVLDASAQRCALVHLDRRGRGGDRPTRTAAEVGGALAAASGGWPLAWRLADGGRLDLGSAAAGALEGSAVPVARDGPR